MNNTRVIIHDGIKQKAVEKDEFLKDRIANSDFAMYLDDLKALDHQRILEQKLFLANTELKGFFKYNPTASSGMVDNYHFIETDNGDILERVDFGVQIDIRKYGAVSDWNSTSRTGTDCTEAIQMAHDECVRKGGGTVLIPSGSWLANGTVYVNNDSQTPVSFVGEVSSNQVGFAGKGSTIIRNVSGDIFRVNLKEDGKSFLNYPALYYGASFRKLSFLGKKAFGSELPVYGIVAIKCYRVQGGIFEHLSACNIDELIVENDNDTSGVESYNDQCSYYDIRITNSLKGGLRLFTKDISKVRLFSFQAPSPTCKYGIFVKYGTTVVLENILWWTPAVGYAQYSSESAFVEIQAVSSVEIKSVHIERSLLEYAFKIVSCRVVKVSSIHSRFVSNDFFNVRNTNNFELDGWDSWEEKNVGKADFVMGYDNKNCTFRRCVFRSFLTGIEREAIITGNSSIICDESSFVLAQDAPVALTTKKQQTVRLPNTITANRPIVFPSVPDDSLLGMEITILNYNQSAFNWTTSVNILTVDGSSINVLPNQSAITIECTIYGLYRIKSMISSDYARKSVENTFNQKQTFNTGGRAPLVVKRDALGTAAAQFENQSGIGYVGINAYNQIAIKHASDDLSDAPFMIMPSGNVQINENLKSADNASALFRLNSATKAFKGVTMTKANRLAIVLPEAGYEVYQIAQSGVDPTEEGKYVYKSTGWTKI